MRVYQTIIKASSHRASHRHGRQLPPALLPYGQVLGSEPKGQTSNHCSTYCMEASQARMLQALAYNLNPEDETLCGGSGALLRWKSTDLQILGPFVVETEIYASDTPALCASCLGTVLAWALRRAVRCLFPVVSLLALPKTEGYRSADARNGGRDCKDTRGCSVRSHRQICHRTRCAVACGRWQLIRPGSARH
jgi:hypothetical protein